MVLVSGHYPALRRMFERLVFKIHNVRIIIIPEFIIILTSFMFFTAAIS